MKTDTYTMVTNIILEQLEKGKIPWKKPWKDMQRPRNLVSNRPYHGTNFFLLSLMGYSSPYWATFKQIAEKGGNVRKGERSTPVVFWGRITKEDEETGKKKTILFPKYFNVFNLEQAENLEAPTGETPLDFKEVSDAEEILEHMPSKPVIHIGTGDRACYSPARDEVDMPAKPQFNSSEEFYSTLFHELVHSTGHESRIGRPGITKFDGFGSEQYAREELIAEMGSAFLCAEAGIDQTIENAAAYIQTWSARIREDKRLIIHAAAQAQKAADFILNRKPVEAEA